MVPLQDSQTNPVLAEYLASGTLALPDGGTITPKSHVPVDEGRFLQGLVREVRAELSLEIGMAFGISSLFICDALPPQGRHISIDPYQTAPTDQGGWGGVGLFNLRRAGLGDRLLLMEAPSYAALPELLNRGEVVDFAFIDGWHTFDYALVDFFYIDRMLRVGGIVAFDDATSAAVQKVCRYVATNRHYEVHSCLKTATPGASHRLAVVMRWPKLADRVVRPELLQPGLKLGLIPKARCVAFRKVAEDDRRFDFHRSF